MFPEITHISQLNHLRDDKEFIFKQEGDLTIVFYAVAFEDTFSDDIKRECRGITFDKDGNIHSRPYHKFFNLNEKEETQEKNVDFNKDHNFLEKLDGSMVRPVTMNGEMRLFTKAGLSDVALEAEKLAFTEDVKQLCKEVMRQYGTPIFEYIGSPNYAIVCQYEEPKLVLTGIRCNENGEYLSQGVLEGIGWAFDVPVVKSLDISSIQQAVTLSGELVDAEGYVVRFSDGSMLKVKGYWYCRRHSAKDKIMVPRKLVKLILENDIDDIKPNLSEKELDYVNTFEITLHRNIDILLEELSTIYNIFIGIGKCGGDNNRQEFAKQVMTSELSNSDKGIMFKLFDGKELTPLVLSRIIKTCSKDKAFEEVKYLIKG